VTTACRVILVGMMGSGKSTVGQLLSDRTGWPHHDNDELLDRLFGATPRRVLAESGEARLRETESSALALGLESSAPCIIGAAAGTILDGPNRGLVREAGVVVWLRASPESLSARAFGAEHRPWLETGGEAWVRSTVAVRDPLYASVADVIVDTDRREPEEIAEEILGHVARLCPEEFAARPS
jgi:shikimate kinase